MKILFRRLTMVCSTDLYGSGYHNSKRLTLFAYLSCFGILFSQCSKNETKDVIPLEKVATTQTANALTPKTKLSNLEKWNQYIYAIESGKSKDATGQYVSKSTQVQSADGIERPTRPKYKFGAGTNAYQEDPEGGAGMAPVVGPQVFSNFVSSEGIYPYSGTDNPNGYIWDMKIVKREPDFEREIEWGKWNELKVRYALIDVDLNRGAGGIYFYLVFNRKPKDYIWNPKGNKLTGQQMEGPITGIQAKAYNIGGGLFGYPAPPDLFYNLCGYRPTFGLINEHYGLFDLNDGAGGKLIYAFESKADELGPPIKEIGVLYGNADSIQPPAGWKRDNQDLNQGAGGDYIYFCYKF